MEYLITSIKCFKRALMVYKRQPFTVRRNPKMSNDIKFIMDFYKLENNNDKSKDNNSFYNFNDLSISQTSLFSLSYLNLLFCLSLDKKYTEILLLIKVFPPKLLENNKDLRNKLDYFKLYALLNLKKYPDIEDIINKNIEEKKDKNSEVNNINDVFDCFNINCYKTEEKFNHKSYLILAEIYLDCRLKRYDKAEKKIKKLIKLRKLENKNEISKYFHQLLLYILSLKNKKNQIINLLKYRWIQIQNKDKNTFIEYKNGDKDG